MQAFQERRTKMDEAVRGLEAHMTKLRYIYTKVQESTKNMETRPIEVISNSILYTKALHIIV